jgi:transcription elongation factor GreA
MAEETVLTSAGLQALREEVETLETTGREEVAQRIRTAREWGDLKENAEYHDAKNDQALLETKIARLRERLAGAVVVEPSTDGDVVGFGSAVTVADEDSGRQVVYTLVGVSEADPRQGRVSAESPVARALGGHRVGDLVDVETPRGGRRLRVLEVTSGA